MKLDVGKHFIQAQLLWELPAIAEAGLGFPSGDAPVSCYET